MLECAAGLESQTKVIAEQRLTSLGLTQTPLSAYSEGPGGPIPPFSFFLFFFKVFF